VGGRVWRGGGEAGGGGARREARERRHVAGMNQGVGGQSWAIYLRKRVLGVALRVLGGRAGMEEGVGGGGAHRRRELILRGHRDAHARAPTQRRREGACFFAKVENWKRRPSCLN